MSEQTTTVPVVAKPGCVSQITTVLVGLLAVSALTILALTLLGIDPWGIAAARLAPTVQTRPTATPRATSLPVQPAQSGAQPAQPVQATTAPVAQPVAPAPVVVEQPAPVVPTVYVPPAEPIVQPTADPWYLSTIREQERDACSMPRANPQTCAGDVPEIPWPNGRNP